MRKLVVILGVPIDDLTMPQALDRLEEFVEIGRRTGKVHQVATVNADFVVKAMQDPELRLLLQEADMATADGMPLVWGARQLGVPLTERVTGADLVPALAERAAGCGYSMYFLGAQPGVAQRAAQVLQERFPALRVAGVCSPPYGSILEMDSAIVEEIKAASPDILLIAFGNPKQEKWIGMYGREVGVPVMIGVGGTLDFIAGEMKRAPEWLQGMGLEWLYRLVQEPLRLWRRYLIDMFGFSTFFLRQWWIMRNGGGAETVLPYTASVIIGDTAVVRVEGRLDVRTVPAFHERVQEVLAETSRIVVNLEAAAFLDSSAIGTLVALTKQARDSGGQLVLAAVPSSIRQTLALLRLEDFFQIYPNVASSLAEAQRVAEPEPVQIAGRWQIYQAPRRLDAGTAPTVGDACLELLGRNPHLILDFSDTYIVASAGLALLAKLHRLAAEQNGELRITGCSKDVLRVIQLVRFDKLLAIYNDPRQAVELVPQGGQR